MTKAYAVEGLHYCDMCFPWLYSPDENVEYDLIAESDFPTESIPCEQCAVEDVFYRATYTALDLSDESWLIPWPTEPGFYWFHGWRHGDDGKAKPRTYLVEMWMSKGRPAYAISSRKIYKSEACGVWRPRPVTLPIPPQAPKGEV